jgi:hypothetical protein
MERELGQLSSHAAAVVTYFAWIYVLYIGVAMVMAWRESDNDLQAQIRYQIFRDLIDVFRDLVGAFRDLIGLFHGKGE